ncbi:MAG: hypothetical protein WD875_19400 [Pirellulales bacterium]
MTRRTGFSTGVATQHVIFPVPRRSVNVVGESRHPRELSSPPTAHHQTRRRRTADGLDDGPAAD